MPGPSAAPRALAERAAGCGGRRTDRGRKGMRAGVQVGSSRCAGGRGWPRSSWARATEYPQERQSPACTMQRILGPDARQATGDIGLCLNVQRLRAASANVPCHELHGALHPPRHRDSLAAEACAKAFGARRGLPPCTRFFSRLAGFWATARRMPPPTMYQSSIHEKCASVALLAAVQRPARSTGSTNAHTATASGTILSTHTICQLLCSRRRREHEPSFLWLLYPALILVASLDEKL